MMQQGPFDTVCMDGTLEAPVVYVSVKRSGTGCTRRRPSVLDCSRYLAHQGEEYCWNASGVLIAGEKYVEDTGSLRARKRCVAGMLSTCFA